jgi:spore coat polysaccharide biosynthesis predicted glycosyltransferase SpsG
MKTGATATLRCVFRVAAGPRIGFGHLLRARALSRAFGQRRPVVSVRGGRAARATARALGCELLASRARQLEHAHVLIVDDPSPRAGGAWIRRAQRAGVATVAVHDAGTGAPGADVTVDGSLVATKTRPRANSRLAGPSFCILDPVVARMRQFPKQSRRQPVVLVSLGGGGQIRRHAALIVEEISRLCPTVTIRVAAGLGTGRLPRLSGGEWVAYPQGLAGALRDADVAVVAGGVTLYEACALGTPAVATAVVSAQRYSIDAFVDAGAALDGGHIGIAPAVAAESVAIAVARLVGDAAARRCLAAKARRLVDGSGAARVATHIARVRRSIVRTPAHD